MLEASTSLSHVWASQVPQLARLLGPLLAGRASYVACAFIQPAHDNIVGIQLDTDLSLQLWRHGFQVGLWYSAVSNGVGGRKTRTDRMQKRARNQNDLINGRRCERSLRQHDMAAVDAANKELWPISDPAAARDAHIRARGMLAPKKCRQLPRPHT